MIRVVHILGNLSVGGVESFIMSVYRRIDRNKIQFDFLVHNLENDAYREEIENLGGRIFILDRLDFKNPLKYIRDLDNILEDHKEISILHCHFRGTEAIILKEAKKHGFMTISHNHGPQKYSKVKSLIRSFLKKDVLKYSDLRLSCSDKVGRDFYGKGSYIKINNGIDLEKYKFDEDIRRKIRSDLFLSDKYVLINVGSLSDIKNQAFLIRLMPNLLKKNPDIRLLLVGDGPIKGELENLCKDLKVKDQVVFLGNSDRVNELLMAADIFLFPSKREGLGISAIEAQASGLVSLLSTNVPREAGISEGARFIDLDRDKWTYEILNNKGSIRKNVIEEIRRKGYDIETSVSELTRIYFNMINE